jgi:hypothetical protein
MTTTATPAETRSRGHWTGPTRRYDLLKEASIALLVVVALTTLLAALFASPDEASISLQSWAKAAPDDVVATVAHELAGDSTSAGYGPPYNTAGEGQTIGPIKLAKLGGTTIPVDSAQDFVLGPLGTLPAADPVHKVIDAWQAATPEQQAKWAGDYTKAIDDAGGAIDKVATGDYGPVPDLAKAELAMATDGRLDTAMVAGGNFFVTDYTKPLLFLGDGTYLEDRAGTQHLQGSQWGMMNSTGNYPGQAWLWLYTVWYQLPLFANPGTAWADNADAIIWGLMMVLSLLLVLVPFLPGVRSVPRWVPVYRLIWRHWYGRNGRGAV